MSCSSKEQNVVNSISNHSELTSKMDCCLEPIHKQSDGLSLSSLESNKDRIINIFDTEELDSNPIVVDINTSLPSIEPKQYVQGKIEDNLSSSPTHSSKHNIIDPPALADESKTTTNENIMEKFDLNLPSKPKILCGDLPD